MGTEEEGKPKKRPWRKWLIALVITILVLLPVVAFLLPYFLKRYIENHSVEWIDRKVTIERIVLNPFTFIYSVDGVTCYEPKSEQVFVSWKKIQVKSNLWRAWRANNWRFRELRIASPYVHVTQKGDRFNFSDLLELGGKKETKPDPADTVPTLFSMEDIQLTDGRVEYASDLLKDPARLQDLHVTCNRITAQDARMDFLLGFAIEKGGKVDGGFMIDTDRSLYAIDAQLNAFGLPQLLPYLQDFMHTTSLKGSVDVDLHLRDSWTVHNALAARAKLTMNDVDVTDGQGERLIGLKKASVRLDTVDAKSDNFDLRSILVDGMYTRFQMWPDGSQTWSKVLKLDSSATAGDTTVTLAANADNVFVMLADYVRMLGQDLVANEYNADSVVFTQGQLDFEDFTPERPFRYALSELSVRSTRLNSEAGSVDFDASALLNGQGRLNSSFKFDPKDFKNVDVSMQVENLALADLDAYGCWYGAHPLLKGTMSYTSETRIHGGQINSTNHLQAQQMKVGKKVDAHDPDIFVLPLRLAVGLLKDVKGNIDLDVPVEGDINDPKFKPWPIIWQVLKNLLVKAVTAPGRLLARAFGGGDDADAESVHFDLLQTQVKKEQRKALEQLVKGVQAKPDLVVALVPLVDPKQEQEELAAFEVKKEFLQLPAELTAADSAKVLAFSTRDSAFVQFLDTRAPATKGQAERIRCVAIAGADVVKQRAIALEQSRQAAVKALLAGAGLPPERFVVRPGTPEEVKGKLGKPGYQFIFDAGEDEPSSPKPASEKPL
jgi:Domain of Unknown Function (DUF748)